MKASVSQPTTWKRVIDVQIEAEEIEKSYQEKITAYRKEIALPGFRAGKVPEKTIHARFGASIRADVLEAVVQKSFESACSDNQIKPIAPPVISNFKSEPGQPVTFTIEAEIEPEITVSGYSNLKIKAEPDKIKPAQIEEVITTLQERLATFSDIDRKAKKGDFLSIEYLNVTIDGQTRTDVTSPQYPIELGENKIKEFDKALIGSVAGEELDIAMKFPKDYGDPDIAGKSGEFKVKVQKIQERALPPIDEAFLGKVGDFKDEAALREKIRIDLETRELDKAKNTAYNKAIDQLIDKNPFEIPPARLKAYFDFVAEDMKQYAKPGEPEPTREEIEQRYSEIGLKTLKRYRIINFIANAEKIKATQEEVDREIQIYADRYHQPFEEIKKRLRDNGTALRIREDLRERKTLDYLIGEYLPAPTAA